MKYIYSMIVNNVSRDTLAWYLLRETNICCWFEAKGIAKEMIGDVRNEQV
mgnify:FL=1